MYYNNVFPSNFEKLARRTKTRLEMRQKIFHDRVSPKLQVTLYEHWCDRPIG